MLQAPLLQGQSLGADLRALRKARGLTLSDLATRLQRSVGWLSQVERDLSQPSISDLRQLAASLEVSVSTLFGQSHAAPDEVGYIVRQGARRPIGDNPSGLVEELLSPDLTDDFEVVHSTFAPQSHSDGVVIRPTQEVGYILSGKLDLVIDSRWFTVSVGDSFRIRGEPHEWRNPYEASALAIWVIAPPVY
jgi:transcriptional regulator with XRE-family HTH domain